MRENIHPPSAKTPSEKTMIPVIVSAEGSVPKTSSFW